MNPDPTGAFSKTLAPEQATPSPLITNKSFAEKEMSATRDFGRKKSSINKFMPAPSTIPSVLPSQYGGRRKGPMSVISASKTAV